MDRHGPILKDNEAMGSGKVSKYLPGLQDTIENTKMAAKVQKSQNTIFIVFFILSDLSHWLGSCWDNFT